MMPNDDHAQFPAPGELRIMRSLPGPIERIWTDLTDPEKRSRWFAGGPMELKQGGKLELFFQHKNIAPGETPPAAYAAVHDTGIKMPGTVLRCEPPRVLSYTFGDDSDVTFELTPQDDKVLLLVTHRSRGEDLPDLATLPPAGIRTSPCSSPCWRGPPRRPFGPRTSAGRKNTPGGSPRNRSDPARGLSRVAAPAG